MNRIEFLKEAFRKVNIVLTESQQHKFMRYYDILMERNQVMNLTAITEYEEAVYKHFIDSVALGNYIDLDRSLQVVDIGTGAGFPGIPLKIIYPKLNVLLLDSLKKRVSFLEEVIGELELDSIEVIHARAEDPAKKPEYREKFDICVSRAVANLSILSEYCIPYIRVGAYFFAYKSGEIDAEVAGAKKAVNLLGAEIEKVSRFTLPDTGIERAFVQILKTKRTPKIYPRAAGKPKRIPIT